MGKLVVTEFMTLDGIIEDPGGTTLSEHARTASVARSQVPVSFSGPDS